MVLKAGLDSRLLTPFSLWLGSIVACFPLEWWVNTVMFLCQIITRVVKGLKLKGTIRFTFDADWVLN